MRAAVLTLSVVLAVLVSGLNPSGQQPAPQAGDLFTAVRQNDLVSLKRIADERGLNARDAAGLTPLTQAVAFGTADSVKALLSLGADVNEASTSGITPLHVAWHDPVVARLLLDKGAKVDAKTQQNATPLLVAASANGSDAVVALLIAKGADPHAADIRGVTPLIAAASVGNTDVAMLLLKQGARPDAYAPGIGQKNVTPLMGAAMNGNLSLARVILRSKPDVNRQAPDNDGTVKNGRVALGSFTALHLAAASQNPEMVKLLVEAGASIDARDVRGYTPLVWAIASDRPNPAVVRVLLQAGADPAAASKEKETPVDWARRYNNPATLSLLRIPVTPVTAPTAMASHPIPEARSAVERAFPPLRSASARMMTDGGCVACHAQTLSIIASVLATSRGWGSGIDEASLQQIQQGVTSGLPGFLQGRESGGQPDSTGFSVLAMAMANVPPSPATDAFVFYLGAKQRDAGNWHALTGRGPMQDGDITRTVLAIKALTVYGSPARLADSSARVAKAARWLETQQPQSMEERVMQLLGLKWGGGDARRIRDLQSALLNQQRADGGWAQSPTFASDAYATGQAIYTLRELSLPVSDAVIRRGLEFLLRSQAADGTWQVTSRALKIQPYFESGFPYGHDQWISHAGSAWAVIGLVAGSDNQPVARR